MNNEMNQTEKEKSKATWRRRVMIKGCKLDFGLGPGVIAWDVIAYTDTGGWGWDDPVMRAQMQEDAIDMVKGCVSVVAERIDIHNGREEILC